MASFIFNSFKLRQLNGNAIDLDTDTIKLALTTSSYTPNQDTQDFFDDVTNEISATGYTAGGASLASKTVTQDDTNNRGVFDAADTVFTLTTAATTRYGVLYKSTGTAGTSALIALIDLATDYTISNGTLTFVWSADGILYI